MLKTLFPFLAWPAPNANTLTRDLTAGLTVALVAIPQSLAYAQLAGLPAHYGLYAALLPTIVGALFGSSAQLSTGPVALTSLLSAASIAPLAAQGGEKFIMYAILLALLAGIIQLGLGLMRLGLLLNFLSHPVLMGFINAAAILIPFSQLSSLLGINAKKGDYFIFDLIAILGHLGETHLPSLALGGGAIVLLLLFRRYRPKWPGVLIVVAIATAISYFTSFAKYGGKVVGAIPAGLPSIDIPEFDWDPAMELLPAAFVVALISFMEATSSSKVIAMKTRRAWDENQELIGQGLAKIAGAFNHCMPVSGSFSRSALNLQAHAASGLSSVFCALFVLVTLLLFTPYLHHIPKPVLAAVIMLAVFSLLNLPALRQAWRANKDDGIAAYGTLLATLAFAPNIQNGILAGIIVSMALYLYRGTRPRAVIAGLHTDGTLRDAARFNLPPLHEKIGVLRFDASLNFVTASQFEDAIIDLQRDRPGLKFILVAAGGINDMDATGVFMLQDLASRLKQDGIVLALSSPKKQITEVLDRTDLTQTIGPENIYGTDVLAVAGLMARANAAETAPAA